METHDHAERLKLLSTQSKTQHFDMQWHGKAKKKKLQIQTDPCHRWKTLLEPISLMMNIHQVAQARPEHIVVSFGFLHFCYSKIENATDLAAHTAVLASAEHHWGQCNQEVFIAAVTVNPFYKISPF